MKLQVTKFEFESLDDVIQVYKTYYHFISRCFDEVYSSNETFNPDVPLIADALLSGRAFMASIGSVDCYGDEIIIGYAICTFDQSVFFRKSYLSIASLYVLPKYRYGSILFTLFKQLANIGRDFRPIDKVVLSVANTVFNKEKSNRKIYCDKVYIMNVR